jgi:hypothetical protein
MAQGTSAGRKGAWNKPGSGAAHARLYAAKALVPRAPWANVQQQAPQMDEAAGDSAIAHDELAGRGSARRIEIKQEAKTTAK